MSPNYCLAQELFVSVDNIFMVTELLARSPDIILGALETLSPAMVDTPGMTPGEEFVKSGVAEMETMEISIRGVIVKVGIAGASMLLGASALGEAKDAVVDGLTHVFGKYQVEAKDELNDIADSGLDGTPDANTQQLLPQADSDVATTSVSFKKAKFEALASNQTTKAIETTTKQKQAPTAELTEAQQLKVQKFMNEVMDAQPGKAQSRATARNTDVQPTELRRRDGNTTERRSTGRDENRQTTT